MDKQEIKLVNEILRSKPWLRVVEEIDEGKDNSDHRGKVEIDTTKGALKVDIKVSSDFPLAKIQFICTSHQGIEHEMQNGLLCLNAAPAKDLSCRLELELEKLQWWVDKYFIKGEKDEHFEYYQFTRQRSIQMLFEEDGLKPLPKTKYGKFKYGRFNELTLGDSIHRAWIAADAGGRPNRWSEPYQKISEGYWGIWLYISGPPIIQGRMTIEKWEDLLKLITPAQTQYLYDESKKMKAVSAYENGFLLLLGYEIVERSQTEMHWDMVLVQYNDFPYEPQKTGPGKYEPADLGKDVDWCKTTNASYKRLFGRGKLSDKLTSSKILIVGTGAIGSSLFMALVRGGCTEIEISDFDDVEPGNICRGQFTFKESFKPKVIELLNAGVSISPYLNASIKAGITPVRKSNKNYKDIKSKLSQFDYIFDCTTDKYLSMMLDEMEFKGQIFNLSITDKADHLVMVTGKGNITTAKSNLYDRISTGKPEPFFVATGCWHPTFQATYTDINTELMYALNEINQKLESKEDVRSFYISKHLNEAKSLVYEISYNV